jgi:hypothetical protein
VETCLFAEPLLSNGCFIDAYFAVVAYKYAIISSYIRISQSHEIKVKHHAVMMYGGEEV